MEQSQELSYLVYVSRERYVLSADDLAEILAVARDFNSQHQITGMLLYRDGSFMQVLEGAQKDIGDLFAKIATDERHHQVDLVIMEPAKRRFFSDWSMGFCDMARPTDKEMEGYTGFLKEGFQANHAPIESGVSTSMLSMFIGDLERRSPAKHIRWN